MKRTLKRLLPIFLCLFVICSIVWYMFSYDRAFTHDLLLSSARFFESRGEHSIATWFYNQAYIHSDNNSEVILELAQQFKEKGNYTQAEVTLSNAIVENPSVDLYIALSQTYVEQDKLLDAANMLENVSDPELKAQLEALRPATPVATPAPGFYNQYITVTLASPDTNNLLFSTDGAFPSVEKDIYQGSISLVGGENTIYAICVGENGLVSQPAYYGYTIGGVVEEVTVSDPALDALFREILGMNSEIQLLSSDLWNITELTVPAQTTDISDLSKLAYLEELAIHNSNVTNFQVLSSLTQLTSLTISNCVLSASDLAAIGSLPHLQNLVLEGCSLSNIEGLSNALQLVNLDLSKNAIRDVSALAFMEHLTTLNLSNNALTDLNALSALRNLRELDISHNSIQSITPITACPSLTALYASYNQLDDLPQFSTMPNLTLLDVSNNLLTNVDVLADFSSLTILNLSSNQLTDISPLASLNKLEVLYFTHNKVTELPAWDTTCQLVTIDGSYNQLSSVKPLEGLDNLNCVILDYNNISNVNPLASCHRLVQVDVFGNPVKDVSKLTAMSVIVNYDPT